MGEADRWRLVSAIMAAACVMMAGLLWGASTRLHAAERHVLHALDGCPLTREDLEHT